MQMHVHIGLRNVRMAVFFPLQRDSIQNSEPSNFAAPKHKSPNRKLGLSKSVFPWCVNVSVRVMCACEAMRFYLKIIKTHLIFHSHLTLCAISMFSSAPL